MFPQKRAPKKSCNKNFPNKSHQIESKSHKNLTKFHQTSRGQDAKMRCIAVGISPQRKITSFRCAKYSRPPRVLQWKSSKCGMVMWVRFNWLQNHKKSFKFHCFSKFHPFDLKNFRRKMLEIVEEPCWDIRCGEKDWYKLKHLHRAFSETYPKPGLPTSFLQRVSYTSLREKPSPGSNPVGCVMWMMQQAGDMETTEVLASRILRIRNRGTVTRLEWPHRTLISMCNCDNTIIIHTVKIQAYDDIGDKQHTLNHMYSHVTLQRAQMFVHVPCFHSRCWVVQKLCIYSHCSSC